MAAAAMSPLLRPLPKVLLLLSLLLLLLLSLLLLLLSLLSSLLQLLLSLLQLLQLLLLLCVVSLPRVVCFEHENKGGGPHNGLVYWSQHAHFEWVLLLKREQVSTHFRGGANFGFLPRFWGDFPVHKCSSLVPGQLSPGGQLL